MTWSRRSRPDSCHRHFKPIDGQERRKPQKAAMGEGSGEQTFDIIVVGAGIMGSCAAYEAAKLGKSVLLLEQFDLLHHLGSSHGESRTIRATYRRPYYPPLVLESVRLWEEAQEAAGYRVLTKTPHLDMGPAGNPSLLAAVRNCSLVSIPAKVIDSNTDLAGLFSGTFQLPDGEIAVITDLGGVFKPTKAVAMFHALALRHGAVIKDRARVSEIKPDEIAGIRISTADGRIFRGSKCVVAVGAWISKMIESLSGEKLPVQPLHALVLYWKIKEGFEEAMLPAAGFPTFVSYTEPHIYGTPSMEFPGLIKVTLFAGQPCDPDRRDWTAGGGISAAAAEVAEWIERVMPGRVETAGGPVIMQPCMYSMTPDEDFIIDFLGGEFGRNVVVAGGFSAHGFKMAPAVGRMVAEMVVGGEAATVERIGVEMRPFRLGRFFEEVQAGEVKE
ncbi:putative sarcosine oxidase [Apostasia shenzhenica]|uniref:Putative sarcosine oxidase n=1 Tax=Apostasia shenzhenica TaxID=1088818 RepID=A0A2I0A793_9ASPA|nr:putative sarcosine oxidase [Apostasia shenzhenica]